MKNFQLFFLFIIIISGSLLQAQSIAQWHTSMGDFQVMLREDLVPITAHNFIDLTNANFYDGLIFHRVIIDFMIQDGDPLGTGSGGPGYSIPDEFHDDLLYDEAGVIGMANAGPNTGGSQYFITVVPTTWLNYSYSAFGNVIEGFDVVLDISEVETTGPNGNPPDRPLEPIYIDSIRIVTPQLFGITPEEDTVYANAGDAVVFAVLSNDEGLEYFWYVNDELQSESTFLFTHLCLEDGLYEIKSIVSNGEFEYPTIWALQVGNTDSEDNTVSFQHKLFQNEPNPFNPTTEIKYQLSSEANVELTIYNLKGQKIRTLVDDYKSSGIHSVVWNGRDENDLEVSSGLYFYRLDTGTYSEIKKTLLLK